MGKTFWKINKDGAHDYSRHWNSGLKLVSANFYQIFIFSPNDSPSKTMKNVFYFI